MWLAAAHNIQTGGRQFGYLSQFFLSAQQTNKPSHHDEKDISSWHRAVFLPSTHPQPQNLILCGKQWLRRGLQQDCSAFQPKQATVTVRVQLGTNASRYLLHPDLSTADTCSLVVMHCGLVNPAAVPNFPQPEGKDNAPRDYGMHVFACPF